MEMKAYFQKLRQTEASLREPSVVVASLASPDGGREGVLTEAPKEIAARLIVEGTARLATAEEAAQFHERMAAARRAAEQSAAASRIQVTVVSEPGEDGKRVRAEHSKPRA